MTVLDIAQIQVRRGTAAQWTLANPTLLLGEWGFESDTKFIKIGDGVTAWVSLPYSLAGAITSAQIAAIVSDETGTGSLVFANSPALSLPVIDNIKLGYATTVTSGGTTTLTAASASQQYFTGTNAQTVVLPVTNTLAIGESYFITNNSTNTLTIQSSGLNTILTLSPGMTAEFTVILLTGTSAASWNGSYNGFAQSALPAGRNPLLNSDFSIWSRGISFTMGASQYTADRFNSTGGVGTVTQQPFTPGNAIPGYEGKYFARWDITGNSINNQFLQKIEDVRNFAGQQITVSIFAKRNSGTTAPILRLVQDFGTGGAPSSLIVIPCGVPTYSATWARYTFTITMPSIVGKTIGTNEDSCIWFSLQITDANTGQFDLWGPQIDPGSVALPYRRAGTTFTDEQLACLRYANQPIVNTYWPGYADSATVAAAIINFPVPMRVVPTATLNPTGFTVRRLGGVTIASTAVSAAVLSPTSCLLSVMVAGGLIAGESLAVLVNTATSIFNSEW